MPVTIGARAEPGEPYHGDIGVAGVVERSVWFQWAAPGSGTLEIEPSGSNFDSFLSLYSDAGTSLPGAPAATADFSGLVKLAGNNIADQQVASSAVTARVNGAETVLIDIDGREGDAGVAMLNYRLRVDEATCIPAQTGAGQIAVICV